MKDQNNANWELFAGLLIVAFIGAVVIIRVAPYIPEVLHKFLIMLLSGSPG